MHQHHVRTHQVEYLHPRLRLLVPRRDCRQIGGRRERGLAQEIPCKAPSPLLRLSLPIPLNTLSTPGSRSVNCSSPPLADRFGCRPDRQDYYSALQAKDDEKKDVNEIDS